MILRCRIHRTRNRADSLLALLLVALLTLHPGDVRGQDAAGSTFEAAGVGWLPAVPLEISAGLDTGYDDNVTTSADPQGSVFTRENVSLTYDRPGGETEIYLLGIGRFAQYFDVTGQDETSGNVTMSLTHNFSSRLSFYASIYGAYQTEPNFKSDVGPENVRAAFFYTSDIFSVTYRWLPRLSTVTSYTFSRIKYEQSSIGSFQDRIQNSFAEEFQFSLTSRTNLDAQYRYETINYDTAPTDSSAHYFLAGVDHRLTQHLIFHLLAGGSARSFQNDGDTLTPYFESSVAYVSSNHSLNWTTTYDFEPANQAGVTIRKTWRTGLNLTYGLTSRINSLFGVNFHHDDNEGIGSQDSLDINLSFRYTISKRLTAHVDYAYTSLSSLGSTPGYSRNRYFCGLTYTY